MNEPKADAEIVDVDEVIPPGNEPKRGRRRERADRRDGREPNEDPRSPFARLLSYVLDECIVVPGTRFRIGLDPILGLVPVGGETIASFAGAFIIGEAYKKGVSLKTIAGMTGNLLLNAGVGAIPGFGDAFSAVFKSNKKNYEILDAYLKDPPPAGKPRALWPLILVVGLSSVALNLGVFLLFVWGAKSVWDLF